MTSSWAQFEANLRKELGRGKQASCKYKANPETKPVPSASSLLKKDDLLLFGSGSVSNLVVVSCLQCDALLKPAFLTHHINKIHGGVHTEGSSSSSFSSTLSTSSSSRHISHQKFKHPPPPNNRIEQLIREDEVFSKNKNKSLKSGTVGSKPKKKNTSKKDNKKSKKKIIQKPALEDKESDDIIRRSIPSLIASPPPSPPTPPRSKTRNKRELNSDLKLSESKEEYKGKHGVFDFKCLLRQLSTMTAKVPCYQSIPYEVTREHCNGLMYQDQRPRPLATSSYGARSLGRGQVVYDRRGDSLRAALNSLLPSRETYKCTSEIKSQDTPVTDSILSMDYSTDKRDDYSDSFSSSRPTSPGVDKLLDIIDPDMLEKSFSDDFLSDTFSWSDYPEPGKLSNKMFAPPGAIKPNLPKLKVDTNQIKSNSAMAVFEFNDPEEGRRAKEEERLRLLRTGPSGRKNKRKINKSPSQVSTPKSNGTAEQPSPSSYSSKRGRYEVIELDKSPPPTCTSPIKHCVASPRQFTYMGYGQQSAT